MLALRSAISYDKLVWDTSISEQEAIHLGNKLLRFFKVMTLNRKSKIKNK